MGRTQVLVESELTLAGLEGELTLAGLVERVSTDLLSSEAQRREAGRPAVFEVASLDVEISFVVVQSKDYSGGVDLKVIRADGAKRYEDQQVQRITLHLRGAAEEAHPTARSGDGSPVRSGSPVLVALRAPKRLRPWLGGRMGGARRRVRASRKGRSD